MRLRGGIDAEADKIRRLFHRAFKGDMVQGVCSEYGGKNVSGPGARFTVGRYLIGEGMDAGLRFFHTVVHHIVIVDNSGDSDLLYAEIQQFSGKFLQKGLCGRAVGKWGVSQHAAFRQVRRQNGCIRDQTFHFPADLLCYQPVWFSLVSHDRINEDKGIFVLPLFFQKLPYVMKLFGGIEKTAADTVKIKLQFVVLMETGSKAVRQILIIIGRKPHMI